MSSNSVVPPPTATLAELQLALKAATRAEGSACGRKATLTRTKKKAGGEQKLADAIVTYQAAKTRRMELQERIASLAPGANGENQGDPKITPTPHNTPASSPPPPPSSSLPLAGVTPGSTKPNPPATVSAAQISGSLAVAPSPAENPVPVAIAVPTPPVEPIIPTIPVIPVVPAPVDTLIPASADSLLSVSVDSLIPAPVDSIIPAPVDPVTLTIPVIAGVPVMPAPVIASIPITATPVDPVILTIPTIPAVPVLGAPATGPVNLNKATLDIVMDDVPVPRSPPLPSPPGDDGLALSPGSPNPQPSPPHMLPPASTTPQSSPPTNKRKTTDEGEEAEVPVTDSTSTNKKARPAPKSNEDDDDILDEAFPVDARDIKWKGTSEEALVWRKRYTYYRQRLAVLRHPYKPEEMDDAEKDEYETLGCLGVRLFAAALHPTIQLPFPRSFRAAVRTYPDLIPAAATTSYKCSLHFLSSGLRTTRCLTHWNKPRRLNEKPSPAELTFHVHGNYRRNVPLSSGILDCGCTEKAACFEFFTWKVWEARQGPYTEAMPLIGIRAREFVSQNMVPTAMLYLSDLFDTTGGHWWNPKHQLVVRHRQLRGIRKEIARLREEIGDEEDTTN
ncbi:hypothetical protein BDN72DRAFT_897014 [Pluteus cervinus]|uniref:Uncharacterized protein n=1 Tax=Pluteus cervinus TaxID=181527 RepID=A0ACD3AWI7_9AGAR|nr:hypothetical protein BDN72DRAFT_897014 [Pluteus cervinus]